MADGEILKHVLAVERSAKELDQRAREAAARRVQEARAEWDRRQKDAQRTRSLHEDAELAQHRLQLAEERERVLSDFQKDLECQREDKAALGRLAWVLSGGKP